MREDGGNPMVPTDYQDTAEWHRGELIEAIELDYGRGTVTQELRRKYKVSFNFLTAVINKRYKVCRCGKKFYPNQPYSKWGSSECYNNALRELASQ